MPSGYTAQITETMPFAEFAMICARAFGACIMMRDDPPDAKIPKEFPASTYHAEALAKAEKELADCLLLSVDECTECARRDHESLCKSRREALERNRVAAAKYERMLGLVKEWNPPSADHVEMKKFMIDQISESIRFDCSSDYWKDERKLLTGPAWREQRIKKLNDDVAYHRQHHTEEVERTNQRNEWIRLLRESL